MTFEKRQDLIGTILDVQTGEVVPETRQLDNIIDGLSESLRDKVEEYCVNDVIFTEAALDAFMPKKGEDR